MVKIVITPWRYDWIERFVFMIAFTVQPLRVTTVKGGEPETPISWGQRPGRKHEIAYKRDSQSRDR